MTVFVTVYREIQVVATAVEELQDGLEWCT